MTTFRKSLIAVLGAVATVLALSAPASAAPAPTEKATAASMGQIAEQTGQVWDEQKQEFAPAWTCASGYVCFYSGTGGSGRACAWFGNDNHWLQGSVTCSWADELQVKSVYNNGASTAYSGVRYYTRPDYNREYNAGCTPRGQHGTLNTPRWLRSHNWETGACG
ncbi:peptidase inhibitor family I36 protein [Kribbella sp. NPDC056345]|uniref:peptidase inhibitor family I36 protein n=1 Tax=Kribbella sp. NPDC056345 TaxID=3345789 RepID=UPI0035DAE000